MRQGMTQTLHRATPSSDTYAHRRRLRRKQHPRLARLTSRSPGGLPTYLETSPLGVGATYFYLRFPGPTSPSQAKHKSAHEATWPENSHELQRYLQPIPAKSNQVT